MTEYPVVLPLANFEFRGTPCSDNHTYEPKEIFYIYSIVFVGFVRKGSILEMSTKVY
jgi:hypothetical protein